MASKRFSAAVNLVDLHSQWALNASFTGTVLTIKAISQGRHWFTVPQAAAYLGKAIIRFVAKLVHHLDHHGPSSYSMIRKETSGVPQVSGKGDRRLPRAFLERPVPCAERERG